MLFPRILDSQKYTSKNSRGTKNATASPRGGGLIKQKRLNRLIARSRRLICSDLSLPPENQFHLGSTPAVLSFPRQTPKSRLRELLLHRLFSSSRRVFPVSRGLTEDRLPYRVSSRDGGRHEWSAGPTVARQFSRTLKIDVRKIARNTR